MSLVFYSLEKEREVTPFIRLDSNSEISMGKLGRELRTEDRVWMYDMFSFGVPGRFPQEVKKQNFKLGEH